MLLINIHQLDIILRDTIRLAGLKHQVDNIRRILGLKRENVLVLRRAENLGQAVQVDAQRDVAVAAEGREALGSEKHGDEGDVGVVHGLEGDAGVIAVEVAVLNEIFDGVDDLGW